MAERVAFNLVWHSLGLPCDGPWQPAEAKLTCLLNDVGLIFPRVSKLVPVIVFWVPKLANLVFCLHRALRQTPLCRHLSLCVPI